MSDAGIKPIVMPKWGLSMQEGKLTAWLVGDGARIDRGTEVLEVETDKIAGVVEAVDAGILRRRLGEPNRVYPVKALLGVLADASVSDAEIDAYVAAYVAPTAEAEGTEAEGPSYAFVDLPEGRVRYAKRGNGTENVLLIHGFGGDLDNWLFNIDALAEQATVYALDLPGHGQSVKTIVEPTAAGLARTVAAFMAVQGIIAAHLVGHSLGGAIAIETGRIARERVRSLVLIASAGLGPEVNAAYLEGFISAASRRELKPVVECLFADPKLVTRQLIDDLLKYKRLDGVEAALKALAAGIFGAGRQTVLPVDALGTTGLPILVIWGREDKVIPVGHAEAVAGAKVEIIEGGSHMVQMEQAGKVNALIKAHIAR